jgi:hypothetical protein
MKRVPVLVNDEAGGSSLRSVWPRNVWRIASAPAITRATDGKR